MRKQTKSAAVLAASMLLAIGISITSFAAEGWTDEGGTWVYYNKDGTMATNKWKKYDGKWYWLGSDGAMAINMPIEYKGDYYYVNEKGVMVTNQWEKLDLNPDDSDGDAWYYFSAGGQAYTANDSGFTSFKTINGKKYAFADDGKMLIGWVDKNSTRHTDEDAWKYCDYYLGSDPDDGTAVIGWAQLTVIDDERYWDKTGEAAEEQNYWFYFQSNGKKVKYNGTNPDDLPHPIKTKTINGKKYGFDENGRMTFEWTQISSYNNISSVSTASAVGNYNYFNDRDNGARVSKGWFKTVPDEAINSLDSDDDAERWYYAYSAGKLCHSEFKNINSRKYAFDNSGRMLDGLQAIYTDSYGHFWNRKLDGEDLIKDGTELKDGGTTTLRLIDAAGLERDGKVPAGWVEAGETSEMTIAEAVKNVADAKDNTSDMGDNFKGGNKKPTFGIYYFGDSNDGAARTGIQNVKIEGESYTFYFKKDGARKGEGINGKKGNYLYQNGKRIKAVKDNKYEAYVYATKSPTQNLAMENHLEYEGVTGSLIPGHLYRVQSSNEAIQGVNNIFKLLDSDEASDKNIYLVNTSGSIAKGINSTYKDGNEMYFLLQSGKVTGYIPDKYGKPDKHGKPDIPNPPGIPDISDPPAITD